MSTPSEAETDGHRRSPTAADASLRARSSRCNQAQKKSIRASISGLFALLALGHGVSYAAGVYGLPWFEGASARWCCLNTGARGFYIFRLGSCIHRIHLPPTGLLIISALSLFLFTAVAGRLWCGYACPQTVLDTSKCSCGSSTRSKAIACPPMDNGPWTFEYHPQEVFKRHLVDRLALGPGSPFGVLLPIRRSWQRASFSLGQLADFWAVLRFTPPRQSRARCASRSAPTCALCAFRGGDV